MFTLAKKSSHINDKWLTHPLGHQVGLHADSWLLSYFDKLTKGTLVQIGTLGNGTRGSKGGTGHSAQDTSGLSLVKQHVVREGPIKFGVSHRDRKHLRERLRWQMANSKRNTAALKRTKRADKTAAS